MFSTDPPYSQKYNNMVNYYRESVKKVDFLVAKKNYYIHIIGTCAKNVGDPKPYNTKKLFKQNKSLGVDPSPDPFRGWYFP